VSAVRRRDTHGRKKPARKAFHDPRQRDLFIHISPEPSSQATANASTSIREEQDIDVPLRLAQAAAKAFPDGSMKVSGLRREAARGRLVIERIAGKDYVTLRAIEDMRVLCRVGAKDLASTSSQREETTPAVSSNCRSGSSETAASSGALALARAKLQKLKHSSPTTSSPDQPLRARGTVIRLRFGSRT
jgi:hypothetical protein